MKKAVYPGSFDPLTNGHLDIISRMGKVCDELIVLIANSPKKNYLFNAEERMLLARDVVANLTNVKVDIFDGLTVDYASNHNVDFIIRGVRGAADLEYEMTMASINKKLRPKIETLIIPSDPEFSFVASRFVKEVAHYGGELSQLVPGNVAEALKKKFN